MTRRIVVPLNGTDRSERALPVAVHLARVTDAPLLLISVAYEPASEHPAPVGYHEHLMERYRDVDATSIVVTSGGSTASAIVAMCRPEDIVCMGVDYTGSVSEIFLGSVFFELVRTFHGPVVAVGPHATIPADADRLLLCVDGLPRALRALDLVDAFGDPLRLTPFLVQAVEADPEPTPGWRRPDVVETAYLQGVTAQMRDIDGNLRTDVGWDVLHGDPAEAIAAAANQPEVAFIGLATDAVDPITRFISPSTANDLLRVSKRPLVLLSSTARVLRSHIMARAIPAVPGQR